MREYIDEGSEAYESRGPAVDLATRRQRLEMISGLTVWQQVVRLEKYIMESLILAQNERWRRVLSMQVERQVGISLLVYPPDGERR